MHKHRCRNCGLYKDDCLCDEIRPLSLATQIILVVHYRELRMASNTGRLAHLLLTNSELHAYGRFDARNDITIDPTRRCFTLYPHPTSQVLDRELVESNSRPITLFVPDGSWRQSKGIIRRVPALVNSPFVVLPPGPPSAYQLRRQKHEGNLSTLEAVARALGIVEGKAVQAVLEHYFHLMMQREMALRGKFIPEHTR